MTEYFIGPACNYRIIELDHQFIIQREPEESGGIWRETNRFNTRRAAIAYVAQTREMQNDQIKALKKLQRMQSKKKVRK